MLSKMIKPSKILEIGTFTGYSAICMTEGLAREGKLITIDINEELEERVRGYFEEADLETIIDYRIGNALDIIPELEDKFELVFIDADKINYSRYFNLIIDKILPGSYIIIDNVLWSGKVVDENVSDKDTVAIREFNDMVEKESRVDNVLLPIRDGLMILRKN
jgi:predicted O-methyltransferase YrrM